MVSFLQDGNPSLDQRSFQLRRFHEFHTILFLHSLNSFPVVYVLEGSNERLVNVIEYTLALLGANVEAFDSNRQNNILVVQNSLLKLLNFNLKIETIPPSSGVSEVLNCIYKQFVKPLKINI